MEINNKEWRIIRSNGKPLECIFTCNWNDNVEIESEDELNQPSEMATLLGITKSTSTTLPMQRVVISFDESQKKGYLLGVSLRGLENMLSHGIITLRNVKSRQEIVLEKLQTRSVVPLAGHGMLLVDSNVYYNR